MSKTRGFRVFIAIISIVLITITVVGCTPKTPEERFEIIRNDITPVESELRDVIKAKAKETLENNDYVVDDLIIKANYMDGMNNIFIYVLAKEAGSAEKDIYTFMLESEFQGPLCTMLRIGSSDGTMYEKKEEHYTERNYITFGEIEPLQYVKGCTYYLDDGIIVMEE